MANSQDQGTQTTSAAIRGRKWTDNEEAWLVVNSMKDVTSAWLHANFPYAGRSLNSIIGHLADMRLHSRLSRKWRSKIWNDEPPYTLREDIEIMQWHVWGREHIDPQIFVANQRAGGSVIARADYLCKDPELVRKVKEAEEAARQALEARDEAWYDAAEEPSDETMDASALRMMNRILFRTESDTIVKICDAISQSLSNREDFEEDDDDEEDEEGEEEVEAEDEEDGA
ncbi:hypothetical protein TMEN_9182 [Trichophyton mentagrophytes]|nr:hypothetical protein TMEN_9182 [Trichophyton mentagrophytes]